MLHPLEGEFLQRGKRIGGVFVLPPDAARDLVARAREENIPVLGVDAFRFVGGAIQPLMEESANYSDLVPSSGFNSWDAADGHIEQRQEGTLHFEIVLGE